MLSLQVYKPPPAGAKDKPCVTTIWPKPNSLHQCKYTFIMIYLINQHIYILAQGEVMICFCLT